jgi:hypothetical protein
MKMIVKNQMRNRTDNFLKLFFSLKILSEESDLEKLKKEIPQFKLHFFSFYFFYKFLYFKQMNKK